MKYDISQPVLSMKSSIIYMNYIINLSKYNRSQQKMKPYRDFSYYELLENLYNYIHHTDH